MNGIYNFSEVELIAFVLVLVRISSFIVVWPVLGQFAVPNPVKVLLGFAMTLCVFYTVRPTYLATPKLVDNFMFLSLLEALYGIFLGFLVRAYFFAFEIAADLMSMSMGLNSAQQFNPAMGRSVSAVDSFFVILVALVYLGVNGHHYLIRGLVESFQYMNPSQTIFSKTLFGELMKMLTQIFVMGFKMAAPIVIAVLVANIVMGLLGKVVPQINVLVMSMPVNISIGFLLLLITMPLLLSEAQGVVHTAVGQLFKVMRGA